MDDSPQPKEQRGGDGIAIIGLVVVVDVVLVACDVHEEEEWGLMATCLPLAEAGIGGAGVFGGVCPSKGDWGRHRNGHVWLRVEHLSLCG